MKKLKKVLIFAAIVAALTCLLCVALSAETISGTCGAKGDGSNLTWSLDTETGVLKIEGKGEMKYYPFGGAPWDKYSSNIKTAKIGDGVIIIGNSAFSSCSSLTSINVDEANKSYKSIDGVLFTKDQKALISYPAKKEGTAYTIPDSVTRIGWYAFSNCSSLASIIIPDSVTSIGADAFYSCSRLTSIEIPDSVTSIGGYAFRDCTNLASIEIPSSVISIGDWAFYGCSGLTKITFGVNSQLTSIGGWAFEYCSSLTSIEIPSSVTSIGAYAFKDCSGLTKITFGVNSQLTSIRGWAFEYCSKLTSIEIPSSVTSIGNYAFNGCSSLTSINVDEANKSYKSIDGVLFTKDQKTLISYPAKKEGAAYTIPDSVTSIGGYAFRDCTNLTSIIIPDSVTSIGNYAFNGCSSLTSITFGVNSQLTSIGACAVS